MTSIAHITSGDGIITLVLGSKSYTITTDHPNYEKIVDALMVSDAEALASLVDIPKAIREYTEDLGEGSVEIVGGEVLYKGKPLHNSVTERILDLMADGYPFKPMLLFLQNLMQNPSAQSVNELYDFLEHQKLPITEDGHFLCYKGTRADGFDRYSGTIMNGIGDVIEVERNEVDDRRDRGCSFGLHVGTISYVRSYCTERIIVCKVNPRDAVSVPHDHSCEKLRVSRYEIVGIYEKDLDEAPVYRSDDASPLSPDDWQDWPTDEDYDDEYEEPDVDVDVSDYAQRDSGMYYNRRGPDGRFTK